MVDTMRKTYRYDRDGTENCDASPQRWRPKSMSLK
jgi:hypothetical protein